MTCRFIASRHQKVTHASRADALMSQSINPLYGNAVCRLQHRAALKKLGKPRDSLINIVWEILQVPEKRLQYCNVSSVHTGT